MQGLDEMPASYRHCFRSWTPLHPGWDVKVWDRDLLGWIENAWIWENDNPTVQSDVARVEVVYREGGVYLDADMECLRNIGGLIDGLEAFASMRNSQRVENAGFGAVPRHPWLRSIIDLMSEERHRIRRVLDVDRMFNIGTSGRSDVRVFPYQVLHLMDVVQDRPYLDQAYAFHHRLSRWMKDDDRFAQRYAEREVRDVSSRDQDG